MASGNTLYERRKAQLKAWLDTPPVTGGVGFIEFSCGGRADWNYNAQTGEFIYLHFTEGQN